ncbi:MAG: tetratricopeptide repeat protein [Kiritimatiellae bacterium]|nr:tetratricopeptide repeat protein [Kiritimatiellia bacterium]
MKTTRIILVGLSVAMLASSLATADIISATLKFTRTQDMVAEADRSDETGDWGKALLLYKYALNSYTEIMIEDPDFQPDMIEFRMEYCDGRLAALLNRLQPEDPGLEQGPATNQPPTVATAPEDVPELLALARGHLEEGESDAARAQLIEGFKVDPDNVNLRLLAGLAQCQARRFGDAIFLLKELSIEEPSNASVRVGLAAAYFGDGQREAAAEELEAAISLEPDMADAHYNMAQLMLAGPTPDNEAAYDFYHRALELGATPDPRLEALFESGEE